MSIPPRFESYGSLVDWIDLNHPEESSQGLERALQEELTTKRLTYRRLEGFLNETYHHFGEPKTRYVEQAVFPLIRAEAQRIKEDLRERLRPWILDNELPAALNSVHTNNSESHRLFFYVEIGREYLKRRQIDPAKAILALIPNNSVEFFDLSEEIHLAEHNRQEEGPLGEDGEKYTWDHFLAQIDFLNYDRSLTRLRQVAQESLNHISRDTLERVADQARALEYDDWRASYIIQAIDQTLN